MITKPTAIKITTQDVVMASQLKALCDGKHLLYQWGMLFHLTSWTSDTYNDQGEYCFELRQVVFTNEYLDAQVPTEAQRLEPLHPGKLCGTVLRACSIPTLR